MKRSSCASGRGYVPSCSIGFCVASTKNGAGKGWVWPAAVTWCSCIAWSSAAWVLGGVRLDRKSTRLNSSHGYISYAVFCLKKKKGTGRGRLLPSRELVRSLPTYATTRVSYHSLPV